MPPKNENDKSLTFMEGLLAFLMGLIGFVDAVLDKCTLGVPKVDRFIKPFFYVMFTIWLLTGMLELVGGDVVLEGAWTKLISLIPNFSVEAASTITAPVPAGDVPIVPTS